MKTDRGPSKGLEKAVADAEPGDEGSLPRVYTVWYGTNRRHADPSDPLAGYSRERDDTWTVHQGWCRVSIPRTHRFGSVGSARWRRWLTGTDDRLRAVEGAGISPPILFKIPPDQVS